MEDNTTNISGKRQRTSRFVTVDGHQVLKTNLYTLQDGEPSVWNSELGDKQYDQYNSPKKVVKKTPAKENVEERVKKVIVDEKRDIRMSHNEKIKLDIEQNQSRKLEFLRTNWNLLKPFLDQETPPPPQTNICHRSYPPLTSQPECLKNVEMRDYQLAGINWLIKSYAAGINVILGGMFLYRSLYNSFI
jgi:hypothetical protein